MKEAFDFNDIQIIPDILSTISKRSECKPFYDDGKFSKLPLIAAPMYDVINPKNVDVFTENGIVTILPRNLKNSQHAQFNFYAFGLNETPNIYDGQGILIDIANGHMSLLVEKIKELKKDFPNSPIMVGNVARPETFRILAQAGADYIRVGIGVGSVCLTTTNSGVGYPLASLINECKIEKSTFGLTAKIVADGGLRSYSDCIKAIALGADYCMVGGIFAKSKESAAEKFIKTEQGYLPYDKSVHFGEKIYAKYGGMSTKEAQRKMGKDTSSIKTSEGTFRYIEVEYTLSGWIENFVHYLQSAMSYTNSRTLEDFKNCEFVKISQNAWKRIDK